MTSTKSSSKWRSDLTTLIYPPTDRLQSTCGVALTIERIDAAQAKAGTEVPIKAGPSEVAASKAALDEAVRNLDEVSSRPDSADFLEIEATLQQASLALRNDVLDRIHGASEGQHWQDPVQEQIDPADAQEAYEDAQKDYDDALTTEAAQAVLKARTEAMVAQQNYDQSVAGGTSQR
jgi:hypothetical protein